MRKIQLFFYGQGIHGALLFFMLVGLLTLLQVPDYRIGGLWGVPTIVWFWSAVVTAVIHQIYVWLCWRSELHFGLISKMFQKRGFFYYSRVFFALVILRPVLVFLLAIANANTLAFSRPLLWLTAAVFFVPVAYLIHSIAKYFGFERATGIDHFDVSFRAKPLVRQGIFRYFRNPMYTLGPLAIWIPGLLFASKAALLVALFEHMYIWVHYFCTEKPDLLIIYGPRAVAPKLNPAALRRRVLLFFVGAWLVLWLMHFTKVIKTDWEYYRLAGRCSWEDLKAGNFGYDDATGDYYRILRACDQALPAGKEIQLVLSKKDAKKYSYLRERGRYFLYPRNFGDNDLPAEYILVYGVKGFLPPPGYERIKVFSPDKFLLSRQKSAGL